MANSRSVVDRNRAAAELPEILLLPDSLKSKGAFPFLFFSSEIGLNNQLIMDDRYSFQYDAEGNLSERTHHLGMAVDTFTWDHRNRLTGVSRSAPREWVQFDIEGSNGDRLVDYLGNATEGYLEKGASVVMSTLHGGHVYAAQFDGVNDHANLGIQDWFRPQATGMTISAWFRPELKSTEMGILSFGSLVGHSPGYALSMAGQGSSSASSQLIFAFSDGVGGIQTRTYVHPSSLVGNWQHVGVTIDGEQAPARYVRLYLNGVQVDSFPFTETQPWGPVLQPLVLGAKSAGTSDYFKGQLDDVRFVPYALDGAQHFLWMMQNPYPATLNRLLVNYTYDHQNRLISRTADPDGLGGPLPAVTEYYVHDGPGQSLTSARLAEDNLNQVGQIVLRLDAAGQVLNRYVWGPGVDQLVADEQVSSATSAGDTLWALADHLGTIRDLVRYNTASQTVESVVHRTYDSFGNITNEINPEAVDVLFGYTGRPFDPVTGLQNNLNRWYDPRIGRWISEDPIGFAAGDANLYRYVGNASPVATDASGTSITVITNHESAGGFGHTGVIVGDISTGYTYYSYEHDRDRSKGFDTFQDAWDYAQGVGYDSYYGYYTTPEEDAAAKDEMVRQKQNRYRFFRNNCEDAAMAVVNAGGQDTKNCLTRMALELS